jgi:hypothetical protein
MIVTRLHEVMTRVMKSKISNCLWTTGCVADSSFSRHLSDLELFARHSLERRPYRSLKLMDRCINQSVDKHEVHNQWERIRKCITVTVLGCSPLHDVLSTVHCVSVAFFPWCKKLINQLQPVLKLRILGSMHPLPHTSSWCGVIKA